MPILRNTQNHIILGGFIMNDFGASDSCCDECSICERATTLDAQRLAGYFLPQDIAKTHFSLKP